MLNILPNNTTKERLNPNVKPVATISSITDSGGNINTSFTYSSVISSLESNQIPVASAVTPAGTFQEGQIITVTFTLSNNTIYTPQNHIFKVYRGTSVTATSPTQIYSTTGSTTSFQYTIVTADVGSYLIFEITPVVDNGNNPSGTAIRSYYSSQVSSVPSVLDVFDLIRLDAVNVDSDWNSNPSADWLNIGSTGNATKDTNYPVFSTNKLVFTRTSSHRVLVPKTTYTEPKEFWLQFKLNTTGALQNIIAMSGSSYLRVSSGNAYQVNGVTISTHVANTSFHTARLVRNGASSSLTIDNGSPVTFNSGGTTMSGSTLYIGGSSSASNFASMDFHFLGLSSDLLSAGEVTNVWNYFLS